jgi:hypothetical protein
MPFSGMLCRVTLITTEVSQGYIAPIIKVTRIGELAKTLAITSNRSTLMIEVIRSYETLALSRATRRNISEDGVLTMHVFEPV